MAQGLFAPSTSKGLFQTTGASAGHAAPHGVGGFVENFATDVKDSVEGLPAGVVHLATTNPVDSVKQLGHSVWQTWSPLFHGNIGGFAHGVYAHPLAPLLDVTSVLDLGLGTAGRLGELSIPADQIGTDTSLLGNAARLRAPKSVELKDPLGSRHDLTFNYSQRPLRRLMQEHVVPAVAEHLPESTIKGLQLAHYNKLFFEHMAHRVAAKTVSMTNLMKAGKMLTDPATAARARMRLAAGAWLNLYRNAAAKAPVADSVDWLMAHPHYRPIKDVSLIDPTHARRVQVLRNKETRLEALRARNVELAHALPRIQQELEHHTATLKEMQDKGYRIVLPASTKLKEPTERQLMERNAAPVVEVQRNISRLEKQLARAHTAKGLHDRATELLSTVKAQRLDAEQRSFREHFQAVASSPENFDSYATHLGRKAVVGVTGTMTRKKAEAAIAKAAVGGDGMVRFVPKHDPTLLGHEMQRSSAFVKWMYKKPTAVWKMVQVGWTPRTVVNNSVGNLTLYALREHPVSGAWGLWNAMKITHGAHAAGDAVMKATPFKAQHWMFKHFSTELNNVFGHELLDASGRTGVRALKSGFYPLVHKMADEPIRMAAISAYLKRAPEIKAFMQEHPGLTFDQSVTRVLKRNPSLVQRAAEHARNIAGDYQTLSPREQTLRNIAPFYMWDRHIVRSTKNLVADSPTRAVALSQVSQMGKGQTQKLLGDLPEFLQGALPLSMLGIGPKTGDRASILETHSLNPFATIGELGQLAQAVTVGHNVDPGNALLSQINPLLTGVASYATGTNLETGAPVVQHGGVITSVASQLGQNFPEYKVVEGMLAHPTTVTKTGKEKEFATNREAAISSFLGVPIRNLSKSAAKAASDKEKGVKKGHAKKRGLFQ